MRISLALIATCLVCGTIALAADNLATQALKDYEAHNAKSAKQYQASVDAAAATYVEEARKNQVELISQLEKARKDATAADRLDEAVRLRDMIRELEKTPVTPPTKESDKQERRKSEMENERLKAALAKREAAQKILGVKELSKALVNTKWQSLAHKAVMEFQADGKALGWEREPGTWSVDPDGTILIKWASMLDWTMHVNAGFTGAVTANNKGQGDRLKLVK